MLLKEPLLGSPARDGDGRGRVGLVLAELRP